jgi:hypothetical protein
MHAYNLSPALGGSGRGRGAAATRRWLDGRGSTAGKNGKKVLKISQYLLVYITLNC